MGFWDVDVRNSFEGMFDYNRDGKLDPVEQGIMFDYISDSEKESNSSSNDEPDVFVPELDMDELADMDESEREAVLEEAGYDPSDFDCDF